MHCTCPLSTACDCQTHDNFDIHLYYLQYMHELCQLRLCRADYALPYVAYATTAAGPLACVVNISIFMILHYFCLLTVI
jgi:hypothetical protein